MVNVSEMFIRMRCKVKVAWMAILQPPGRKSRFAGKAKRLVLETAETVGGTVDAQAEYESGTAWASSVKIIVAAAGAPLLRQARVHGRTLRMVQIN